MDCSSVSMSRVVCVVHECVYASDGCKSLWLQMTICLWRKDEPRWPKPRKRKSECVTAYAGLRKSWRCVVVDGVLVALPVGRKIAIFGARPFFFWIKFEWGLCSTLTNYSTCRRSTTVAKVPFRMGSLQALLESEVSCDQVREPCCCCDCCCCCQLGFGKFGGAKGSASVILCLSWIAARNSGLFPPCWLGKCRPWNRIHLRLSLLLRPIQHKVEILCVDHLRYICQEWSRIRVLCNCDQHLLLCSFLAVRSRYPRPSSSWFLYHHEGRCREQFELLLHIGVDLLFNNGNRIDKDMWMSIIAPDVTWCICGNFHIEPNSRPSRSNASLSGTITDRHECLSFFWKYFFHLFFLHLMNSLFGSPKEKSVLVDFDFVRQLLLEFHRIVGQTLAPIWVNSFLSHRISPDSCISEVFL